MMKKVAGISITLAAAIALTGCGSLEYAGAVSQGGVRHQYQKNYTVNVKQKVYVGEPVIQVRDYYVETKLVPQMEPTETFNVRNFNHPDTRYEAGRKYDVIGLGTFRDSEKCSVIRANGGILFFIDATGGIQGCAIEQGGGNFLRGACIITLTPPSAKFKPVSEEKILIEKGYINFEVLYSGMDRNTMTFTYREYSPEGLARVAFYQTLTYDSQAKSIRFKKFRLDIVEASSEGITYAVVEE